MRIEIIAFGKGGNSPEQAITERYLARINPRPRFVELLRGPLPPAPPGTRTLLLDEGGANWSSARLAQALADWRDSGLRDLRFLIGPADGHDAATRACWCAPCWPNNCSARNPSWPGTPITAPEPCGHPDPLLGRALC